MNYTYTINYPKGGSNPMWEPMNIVASTGIQTGLTVIGRTYGRDGCKIQLFDEDKKEMAKFYYYSGAMEGPISHVRVARDIAENMNIIFELEEKKELVKPEQMYEIFKIVIGKCESRYGNKLPDSDYEVMVSFK